VLDFIFVLLALVALGIPVAVIVLIVVVSRLSARVRALEEAARAGPAPAAPEVEAEPSRPAPEAAPPETAPQTAPTPAPDLPDLPPVPPAPPAKPTPDYVGMALAWTRVNWVYVVAAASLALAGIFLVQYGIEAGLFPPPARVAAAIALGLALIGFGEWLRRRGGDEGPVATANLPSVFSGAGLVSIFAGLTAGRLLYALYGPGIAFTGLAVTAAGAVLLGWRHGPLLVAVGLLGAALAPFLVDGAGAAPWLHAYYVLIAATGLAVDTIRLWRWVSWLALALGFGGSVAMALLGAGEPGLALAMLALTALALTLPQRRLVPDDPGPGLALLIVARRGPVWPPLPLALAGCATLAATLVLAALSLSPDPGTALLALLGLAALFLLLVAAGSTSEGVADLALLPALGFLAALWAATSAQWAYLDLAIALREPESPPPLTASLLLALAVAMSGAAAWRALRPGPFAAPYALAATLIAPLAAVVMELAWSPAAVTGAYGWALHVMALAGAMVLLATRFAAADGGDRRRAAWATLSALSLIALSFFILTAEGPLTLALAVLLIVAAELDRRFDLPEMGWFLQLGVAVLGYRLLIDPGLDWAIEAPLAPVVLAFSSAAVAAALAWWRLPPGRPLPAAVLESAALAFAALLADVLIARALMLEAGGGFHPGDILPTHWACTLSALPWMILAAAQLWRARAGGPFRRLRLGVAAAGGVLAAAWLAGALLVYNPLFGLVAGGVNDVLGPPVLDTLALAYGLPGLALLAAARLAATRPLRVALLAAGAGLTALWLGLEIRRLWQGRDLAGAGIAQGELYSYTIALMLLAAGLFWQAIARRSVALQRVAMAVIALTVAKVFLVDASGLTGLTRVVSFLGLGLALAALAWLNRWTRGEIGPQEEAQR